MNRPPIPEMPQSNHDKAIRQFKAIASALNRTESDSIAMIHACLEIEERIKIIRDLIGNETK